MLLARHERQCISRQFARFAAGQSCRRQWPADARAPPHLLLAGTPPPPLAQRRGGARGHARRGAGLLGAPDQRLGAGRVLKRCALGQRPARPGAARRAGRLRRVAVWPCRADAAGPACQPGAGNAGRGAGRRCAPAAAARARRRCAGAAHDRARTDAAAGGRCRPLRAAGAGHGVPQRGRTQRARRRRDPVAAAHRRADARAAHRRPGRRRRRRAGGNGHRRGPGPVRPRRTAHPHRPAARARRRPHGLHARAARVAGVAPEHPDRRARRRGRARKQSLAGLPRQSHGTGAGGAVHRCLPRCWP